MKIEVLEGDAFAVLPHLPADSAIVTSLPDAEEMGWSIEYWRPRFRDAVLLCLSQVSERSPVIFYQTDRKFDGSLISKAAILCETADHFSTLRWHKIALTRAVGKIGLYRPAFAHLMCFSKDKLVKTLSADVFDDGAKLYENAMGMTSVGVAVTVAAANCKNLIDPFCGRGSVLVGAKDLGSFDSVVGIDIDPAQVLAARQQLNLTQ